MDTIVMSWKRFIFPQRNRVLLSLTGILLVMILLIIKYCDFPLCLPEKYFGFFVCKSDTDKLWYNIGISYVAAYIFYIIQVYVPTYNAEKKAFKDIHKQLSSLIRSVKRIRYLLFNMYELGEHGELELMNSSFFFKERYSDSYKQSGDYAYKREILNGKYVRKANGGCGTEAEFRNKLMEEKEIYTKLLSHRSIDQIDRNLYELIAQLDIANYCEGVSNVIFLTGKMCALTAAITESNNDKIRNELRSLIKGIQGVCVTEDENAFYISLTDGHILHRIQKPNQPNGQDIPFHTNVKSDDKKLVELIEKIETICDLDSEISFEEMSLEEEQRYRDKSLTKKIQQIVNS